MTPTLEQEYLQWSGETLIGSSHATADRHICNVLCRSNGERDGQYVSFSSTHEEP